MIFFFLEVNDNLERQIREHIKIKCNEYKIININKLKVPQILGERHLIVIGKNNG